MKRDDILSLAMTRQPHPKYGFLTALKHSVLMRLGGRIFSEERDVEDIGTAWVVCVLPINDPLIEQAKNVGGEDGCAILRPVWEDNLHTSEIVEFNEWFNLEIVGQNASATEDNPDPTRSGNVEASGVPVQAG